MHHAIRIGMSDEDLKKCDEFYCELLGLEKDPSRPNLATIPGFWFNVGGNQIHAIGSEGEKVPCGTKLDDPTVPHVALMVDDLDGMRQKLQQRGIQFWEIRNLTGVPQLFLRDPFGNQIELQQAR
jgi:extradiol dioxygenase family protein